MPTADPDAQTDRPAGDPAPGPADGPEPAPAADRRGRRPVRRGRLLAALTVVAAAAVWFAPGVLARTGLRHTVLHRLAPDFRGEVRVDGADLGWLDPVTLRGVRVAAPGGRDPLFTADELRTARPLHALLAAAWGDSGPAEFGAVTLVRPVVTAAVRPGGSDAEDLFAPLLAGDSESPSPGFTVVIEDGAATLTDPAGGAAAVSGLNATVHVPAGADLPDRADVAAELGDGEGAGDLTGTLADGGAFTLRAQGLPLAAAGPLAVRFGGGPAGGGWAFGGTADADVAGTLSPDGVSATGTVRGERIVARHAAWPVGDRVRLETAELGGGVRWDGAALTADRLRFASAPLTLTADGPLPLALPADPADLLDADRRVEGTADLPALAAMLPGRLRLREGARVDAGALALAAATGAGDAAGTRTLTASADVTGLRATVPAAFGGGERTVTPEGPVSLALAATRTARGAHAVDRLTGTADGLALSGRGTADDFAADVRADLAAFDRTFGGLFALGGSLSGTVDADVRVRRDAPDRFTAGVRGVGRGLAFAPPAGPGLTEGEATGTLAAALVRDAHGIWGVRDVAAKAEAGGDRFAAVPTADGWDVTLAGDLGRWARRAEPWVGPSPVSLAGDTRASAGVRVSRDGSWRLAGGRADVRGLAVDGPGVRVREPAATLEFAGAGEPGGAVGGRFDLTAGPVTVRGRDVRFAPAAAVPWSARVVAAGDAERAWGWFPALKTVAARPAGRFAADVRATLSADAAGAAGELSVARLAVLTPRRTGRGVRWAPAWGEDEVTLAGAANYRFAGDELACGPLALAGAGWAATASGTVAGASVEPVAALSGTLRTDWPVLAPRLGLTDAGVSIAGAADRPWRLTGPLVPPADRLVHPELRGELAAGWDGLEAGGFDFGPGDITATLAGERVRIDGVDWPCAGGRLRTTPVVDLSGDEPVVRLPEGRVLAGVRLTPETTRGWLGLVSPLAAGAARAEGAFSVDLAGATVPLGDALGGSGDRASASGRLRIVRADVTPGPLPTALLRAVRGTRALLRGGEGGRSSEESGADVRATFPTQSVPFRLTGGRVYHEGLRAGAGSVEIATAGSVGLDGSLDLRATVPLGGGGDAQTLAVPVGGTLDAPRLDAARLARAAAAAAVRGAVDRRADALRDRLEEKAADELGRLFGRD